MATPTQLLNNSAMSGTAPANNPFTPQPAQPNQKSQTWVLAPVIGGAALVFGGLGAGAYALYDKYVGPTPMPGEGEEEPVTPTTDPEDNTEPGEENEDEVIVEPDDTEISVVTFNPANVHQSFAVNDDMSFAEAFAAARHDVGAGGVFVWHGNIYGTYTADEWNSMSADDQLAFTSSFHYHAPHEDPIAIVTPDIPDPVVTSANEVALVTEDDDPEIMLISQEYDPESGMTMAYVTDGDNVAMLADVDNDGTYDYLVSDFDGNGEISDDEIVNIADSNLTHSDVENLPGYNSADPFDVAMS